MALVIDDPHAVSDEKKIAAGLSRGMNGWADTPFDVITRALTFCSMKEVSVVSGVCRSFNVAATSSRVASWACSQRGWPKKDYRWYHKKSSAVDQYDEKNMEISEFIAHPTGVGFLYAPEPTSFFSWSNGKYLEYDNNILITGGVGADCQFKVWDCNTGKCIRTFNGDDKQIQWANASMTSTHIVLTQSQPGKSGLVLVNLKTSRVIQCEQRHTSTVTCVDMPEGPAMRCASGSYDRTVRVWDVITGRQLRCLTGHCHNIWSVAMHPSGNIVAAGDSRGNLRMWNVDDETEMIHLKGLEDTIMVIRFDPVDPDNIIFLGGYGNQIKCWDYNKAECLYTFSDHTAPVMTLSVSPYILVSGSRDTSVVVWDRHTGEVVYKANRHTMDVKCSQLLPNGQGIVTADFSGRVIVWRNTREMQRVHDNDHHACSIM
jgi:WD40 repeat protein